MSLEYRNSTSVVYSRKDLESIRVLGTDADRKTPNVLDVDGFLNKYLRVEQIKTEDLTSHKVPMYSQLKELERRIIEKVKEEKTSGLYGMQGAQGAQGSQGAAGQPISPKGIQGYQGYRGLKGEEGAMGVQGFEGNKNQLARGPQGVQGDVGPQGYRGMQGPQGFTGAWIRGPQGPQGVQGESGRVGKITKESPDPRKISEMIEQYLRDEFGLYVSDGRLYVNGDFSNPSQIVAQAFYYGEP